MGIPFYFKNLIRTHHDVVKGSSAFKTCDRLFLDFNCIIHQSANSVVAKHPLASYERLEAMIMDDIMEQIVKLINVIFPRQLLYIAIDGTCPRAKMSQQRKRRYISAWRNDILSQFKKVNNISVTQWDSNIITPGTKFMKQLDQKLQEFVDKNNNKLGFNILLSGSNEIGEGEHKIMQYIRNCPDSSLDVIYGLDADLIMLSLVSPNFRNIVLLREKPEFNVLTKSNEMFLTLNISNLSESLTSTYQLESNIDFTKEYVMLCVLLGNDFLPPLSFLKIKENGIDSVIKSYKKVSSYLNQSLVTDEGLNYMFLLELIKDLSRNEDAYMTECCHCYYSKVYKNTMDKRSHSQKGPTLEALMSELDNFPTINKFNHVIDPSQNGWRLNYYFHLFGTCNTSHIVDICNNYIQGLLWVYNYYFTQTTSYSWYYKYCYSPTLLDLTNTLSSCNFTSLNHSVCEDPHRQHLINNDIQLLLVLPPQSIYMLAPCLRKVVTEIEFGCVHFYPHKFEIATFLKNYLWECSAKLPDIDINSIIHAYSKVTRSLTL